MNKFMFTLLSVCWVVACSTPAPTEVTLAEGQPALHALQDTELRDLMDRMNGLMLERFMTEHEMDIERRKYTRQIIEAAGKLANTAQALIIKMPGLGLNASEQRAFLSLAQKLNQHAQRLQTQAEHHAYNAIPGTLSEMKSDCLACHTLFRKF